MISVPWFDWLDEAERYIRDQLTFPLNRIDYSVCRRPFLANTDFCDKRRPSLFGVLLGLHSVGHRLVTLALLTSGVLSTPEDSDQACVHAHLFFHLVCGCTNPKSTRLLQLTDKNSWSYFQSILSIWFLSQPNVWNPKKIGNWLKMSHIQRHLTHRTSGHMGSTNSEYVDLLGARRPIPPNVTSSPIHKYRSYQPTWYTRGERGALADREMQENGGGYGYRR